MWSRFCLLALLPLASIVAGPWSVSGADFDQDGIEDSYEHELAVKYAPHYKFCVDESFYYIDPALFLNKTSNELNVMFSPFNAYSPFEPNDYWKIECSCDLFGQCYVKRKPPDFPADRFDSVMSGYNRREIALHDPMAADCVERWGWGSLKIAHPDVASVSSLNYYFNEFTPVFYIVELNAEGRLEVQYWQYSHMDNKRAIGSDLFGFGNHISDWSRVVIVFETTWDSDDEFVVIEPPLYTFYSAHRPIFNSDNCPFHPRYLLWPDVHKADGANGTHPIVLVSHDQHELYYEFDAMIDEYACENFRWHREGVRVEGGICEAKPFLITSVDHSYYDKMCGGGVAFDPMPDSLINLGNGDHPNPGRPWVGFGSKWHKGPTGPFGADGGVRFRQHCLCTSVEGDDGSASLVYNGLNNNGANWWYYFCDGEADVVDAVLKPLGFTHTAKAYEKGHFPRGMAGEFVKARFFVRQRNGRSHEPLSASNYMTVTYRKWPDSTWQELHLWGDSAVTVMAVPNSHYTVDEFSSNSTVDHYWQVETATSGQFAIDFMDAWSCQSSLQWCPVFVVEKARVDFDLACLPPGTPPGPVSVKYRPNVSMPEYSEQMSADLTPNATTTLFLPVGARFWIDPREFMGVGAEERWTLEDGDDYRGLTVFGPQSYTLRFHHQYLASVELEGAEDFALSADIDHHVFYGDTLYRYNVYGTWMNWCDSGSTLEFAECLHFYPTICAKSPRSFVISGPIDTAVDYTFGGNVDFMTRRVTDNDVDEENVALFVDKIVWEVPEDGARHVWMYDFARDTILPLSSAFSNIGPINYCPDISGNQIWWLNLEEGLRADIIRCDYSTGYCARVRTDFLFHDSYEDSVRIDSLELIGTTRVQLSFEILQSGTLEGNIDRLWQIYGWELIASGFGIDKFAASDSMWISADLDYLQPNQTVSLCHDRYDYYGSSYYYDMVGSFPPIADGNSLFYGECITCFDEDSALLVSPSLSGYDLAYYGRWCNANQLCLYYADMRYSGYYDPGKEYSLLLETYDTLISPNDYGLPIVSGGYVSISDDPVTKIFYVSLDDVREACLNYHNDRDIGWDSLNCTCYEHIGDLWHYLPSKAYDMSGGNFAAIAEDLSLIHI